MLFFSTGFCPGKFGWPALLLAAAISSLAPATSFGDSAPVVTAVSPTFGAPQGGTLVNVYGSNFTNATSVQMAGTPVPYFTINGPNLIMLYAPASSPGIVDVTVTTPAGSSAPALGDQFTYAGRPVITGLSARSSLPDGGGLVTIFGLNFSGATAVRFGTAPVTTFTVNAPNIFTFNAPGTITLETPAEATGVVDISVTTPGGTTGGTVADLFSFVPTDRFGDISCLGSVTRTQAMTFGFVIEGVPGVTKSVLLRGIGPSLARFPISGVLLPRPGLQVYDGRGRLVATNAGWANQPALAAAFAQTGAFALAPGSADAALLLDLLPGPYSMQIISADGNGVGIALGEVYDADPIGLVPVDRIVNLSSLGLVLPSSSLTVGFVVTGSSPKQLLIRGIGPGLASFGFPSGSLLPNPRLAVYDANGQLIAQNDDWGNPLSAIGPIQQGATPDAIVQASQAAGAFGLNFGSQDAASIVALPPGSYSAVVTGSGGAGTALLEVYELPQ